MDGHRLMANLMAKILGAAGGKSSSVFVRLGPDALGRAPTGRHPPPCQRLNLLPDSVDEAPSDFRKQSGRISSEHGCFAKLHGVLFHCTGVG
jgi:hypothetical protein